MKVFPLTFSVLTQARIGRPEWLKLMMVLSRWQVSLQKYCLPVSFTVKMRPFFLRLWF